MSLLGAVSKVKDFKIHLTLPGGLSGIVPITEVTDTLSELLASKVEDSVKFSSLLLTLALCMRPT
jgi:ribosomal protein S1